MSIKKTATRAITAGILLTTTAAGIASADNVGGGIWNHGFGLTTVYSNYYHPSTCHGSTAIGTVKNYSGNTNPGVWAYASSQRTSSGTNQAYWNYC